MMKVLDVIILIAICWFAFKGFKNGFFDELFSLLAFVAGCWFAIFGDHLVLERLHTDGHFASVFAVVIAFLLAAFAVKIVEKLLKTIVNVVLPSVIDHLLGLAFGSFKVMLLFGAVFHFISHYDVENKIFTPERQTNFIAYSPCKKVADLLVPKFKTFSQSLQSEAKSTFDAEN